MKKLFFTLIVVSLIGVGTLVAQGQEETAINGSVVPVEQRDDQQRTLGNNCNQKKGELNNRFDVCKFGSCSHLTSIEAEGYAWATLTPLLASEAPGCILNIEVGHRTISNSNWCCDWNSWLSYACCDYPAAKQKEKK